MFKCQCGKSVRAIYCDQDNLHYPADECEECYESDRYLQKLYIIKKDLERDLLDCALSLASLEQEIREKEAIAYNRTCTEDDLPF